MLTLRLPSALRGQCSPLEATCYSPPSPLDPDLPETALLPPPLCCSSPFLRCLFLASPHVHAEVPSFENSARFLGSVPSQSTVASFHPVALFRSASVPRPPFAFRPRLGVLPTLLLKLLSRGLSGIPDFSTMAFSALGYLTLRFL